MNFGKFLVVSFVLSVACMSQSIPSGVVGGVAVTPPTNPTGKVSRVLNVNNGYAKGVANYGVNQIQIGGRNPRTITPHRPVIDYSLLGFRVALRNKQKLPGTAGGLYASGVLTNTVNSTVSHTNSVSHQAGGGQAGGGQAGGGQAGGGQAGGFGFNRPGFGFNRPGFGGFNQQGMGQFGMRSGNNFGVINNNNTVNSLGYNNQSNGGQANSSQGYKPVPKQRVATGTVILHPKDKHENIRIFLNEQAQNILSMHQLMGFNVPPGFYWEITLYDSRDAYITGTGSQTSLGVTEPNKGQLVPHPTNEDKGSFMNPDYPCQISAFMPEDTTSLMKTLVHEMSHAVLFAGFGEGPDFFYEGLADWFALQKGFTNPKAQQDFKEDLSRGLVAFEKFDADDMDLFLGSFYYDGWTMLSKKYEADGLQNAYCYTLACALNDMLIKNDQARERYLKAIREANLRTKWSGERSREISRQLNIAWGNGGLMLMKKGWITWAKRMIGGQVVPKVE